MTETTPWISKHILTKEMCGRFILKWMTVLSFGQAVGNINSLLERADRVYRQLVAHRQPLDLLLTKILEHGDANKLQVRDS